MNPLQVILLMGGLILFLMFLIPFIIFLLSIIGSIFSKVLAPFGRLYGWYLNKLLDIGKDIDDYFTK